MYAAHCRSKVWFLYNFFYVSSVSSVSSVYPGCIYLIKTTVKTVIL